MGDSVACFITCVYIVKLQLLLTFSFGEFQTDFASTPRSSKSGKCERKSGVLWGPPQCSCHRCVNLCDKQLQVLLIACKKALISLL